MNPDETFIHKYPLPIDKIGKIFDLSLPWGYRILDIQLQNEVPTLWAIVCPSHATQNVSFKWLFTGDEDTRQLPYLKTLQINGLVYHLFGVR